MKKDYLKKTFCSFEITIYINDMHFEIGQKTKGKWNCHNLSSFYLLILCICSPLTICAYNHNVLFHILQRSLFKYFQSQSRKQGNTYYLVFVKNFIWVYFLSSYDRLNLARIVIPFWTDFMKEILITLLYQIAVHDNWK